MDLFALLKRPFNTLKILTLQLWALTTATRAQIIFALNIDYMCVWNENVFFISKTKRNLELLYLLRQFLILEDGIMCRWNKCSDRSGFFLLNINHVIKWLHYILARECVIIISDRFNYAYCLSILSNCSFNSFLTRGINKGHCGQW